MARIIVTACAPFALAACVGPDPAGDPAATGSGGAGANAGGDSELPPLCGNGSLEPPEVCDDGNNDGSYGSCAPDCRGFGPHCGDAEVTHDERCDDGVNDGNYGHCLADCSGRGPHCGDGEVQAQETCDDGNVVDGDDCGSTCLRPGTLMWGASYDSDSFASLEQGLGVVVLASEAIVSVGSLQVPDQPVAVTYVTYDRDGEQIASELVSYDDSALHPYATHAEPTGQLTVFGARLTPTGTFGWRLTFGSHEHHAVQVTGGPFSHIFGFSSHTLGRRSSVGRSATGSASLVRVESSDSVELWHHRDAELQYDHCEFDSTGNLYVAGSKPASGELFVRKYSHDGVLAWTRFWNDNGSALALALAVDERGHALVVGQNLLGPSAVQALVLGWDATGELVLSATETTAIDSGWSDVVVLDDGSWVVGGWSEQGHAVLRKYADEAETRWTITLDSVARIQALTTADDWALYASGVVVPSDSEAEDDTADLWTGRFVP